MSDPKAYRVGSEYLSSEPGGSAPGTQPDAGGDFRASKPPEFQPEAASSDMAADTLSASSR